MQTKRKFLFLPVSVFMFVHNQGWELVCLGVCAPHTRMLPSTWTELCVV